MSSSSLVSPSSHARPSLQQHRQRFPALNAKRYFNYGGQGPLSQDALDALLQEYQTLQTLGPFSLASGERVNTLTQALRQTLATALGVDPSTLALTENVSHGCNIALGSVLWQGGDHLLISDCEHPSVVATVQELQRRFHLQINTCRLSTAQNSADVLERLHAALTPQTRLVALSHILWNTGLVLPLQDITALCREFGQHHGTSILTLMDAAQSAGVLPLDLTALGVDFYAFTGHKWWCGPEGVGGLYVSPHALAQVRPAALGWRGVVLTPQGQIQDLKPGAQRFEVATSPYPLYSALHSALQLQNQWGNAQERYHRIVSLSTHLWQQLNTHPRCTCLLTTPPQSGLVSFQWQGSSTLELVKTLEAQGILIRKLAFPDCVRAGVHYLTLEEEIEALLSALESLD